MQALSLDLPVAIVADLMNLLSQFEDGLGVVLGDGTQDIERVYANRVLRVVQTD